MQGLTLGIGQMILDGINSIITWAVGGLIKVLINWIVLPVINIVIYVIKYSLSGVFYAISTFLLSMIDFLESLFRSLAGLGGGFTFTLKDSTSWFSGGDLLLQLLTSKDIMIAFEATAIVGIFLLIITTIFQMIKVEYTTEGAENNKTKILGKSLKSLTNLLLIPVLCVFGVFIGNKILNLIDIATNGNENSKISGTLFVTAASDALYEKGKMEFFDYASAAAGTLMVATGGNTTAPAVILAVVQTADDLAKTALGKLGSDFGGESPLTGLTNTILPINKDIGWERTAVETPFKQVQPSHCYWNILTVVQYYNIFEINYLVLILGASVILKCLFHVCFGMVDRIYRCVALFIVAPFVIGMSPVKDSLASWRSNFLGKALAAYGTIISINLFFTIVTVLLNVKIEPVNANGKITTAFAATFYTGLIQSIFVIVGCLMIEKLSSELGNYFGASDGMATGKGLAKEVGDGAKAAVGTAINVAMGVASGGVGLAGALKTASLASKAAGGGFKGAVAGGKAMATGAWDATGGKVVNRVKDAFTGLKDFNDLEENSEKLQSVQKRRSDRKDSLDRIDMDKFAKEERFIELHDGRHRRTAEQQKEYDKLAAQLGIVGMHQSDKISTLKRRHKAEDKLIKDDAEDRVLEEGLEKKVASGYRGYGYYSAAKNYGQKKISAYLPKELTEWEKNLDKDMEEGLSKTAEGKAVWDKIKEDNEDREKKSREDNAVFGIDNYVKRTQEKYMVNVGTQGIETVMKEGLDEFKDSLQKGLKDVAYAVKQRASAQDPEAQKYWDNEIRARQTAVHSIDTRISFDSATGAVDDSSVRAVMNEKEAKINAEIAKLQKILIDNQGKSNKEIMKKLESHVAQIGRTGDPDGILKSVYKALEEIKSQLGGK